jgi:hypothetical protein
MKSRFRFIGGFILFAVISLTFSACWKIPTGGEDMAGENEGVIQDGRGIIRQNADISEYAETAALGKLESLGIKPVEVRVVTEDEYGYVLDVVDEAGKKYWVTLDSYGYVAAVREGGASGELIYFIAE